jgi:hypothetical protein
LRNFLHHSHLIHTRRCPALSLRVKSAQFPIAPHRSNLSVVSEATRTEPRTRGHCHAVSVPCGFKAMQPPCAPASRPIVIALLRSCDATPRHAVPALSRDTFAQTYPTLSSPSYSPSSQPVYHITTHRIAAVYRYPFTDRHTDDIYATVRETPTHRFLLH